MGDFPVGFGRYSLIERLAVGGMAELYLATSPGEHGFTKKVVIKRLLPHLADDQTYNAMFIDEAKLTARLVHPKIAQTFELGKVDDALYIAMEYVDGIDVLALLREFAARRRRIEPQLAVWIAHEVLDALDYAHALPDEQGNAMGVVHRDISPSNVLLSIRGDVKLVDFGIARATDPGRSHKTKSGTLKGKYGYMSPEQVVEEAVDARSDVFSVGVVLAELLSGRRLFAAPNELDVLLMVRDAKLSRLDKYGMDIEPALNELVRKALRKSPDDRWQGAAAFREALAEWLFDHRHRMSNKQVADVVHDLGAAVEARRGAAMQEAQSHATIDERGDRPPGAVDVDATAGRRSPSETDGAPIMIIEGGDSMPVISVSYDGTADESEATKLPVSVSDLAATAGQSMAAAATPASKRADAAPRARSPAVQVPQLSPPTREASAPVAIPPHTDAPSVPRPVAGSRPPSSTPAGGTPALSRTPSVGRTSTYSQTSAQVHDRPRSDEMPRQPAQRTPPTSPARTSPPTPPQVGRTLTPTARRPTPERERERERGSAHDVTAPNPRTPTSDHVRRTTSELDPRGRELTASMMEGAVEVAIADTISAAVEAIMEPLARTSTLSEDSIARAFDDLKDQLPRYEGTLPSAEELSRKRPPTPPALSDIAEPPDDAGELSTTSPLRVLFRLMTARATGLLVVVIGGIKKDIYVRDGQPEYVSSNVASELFGNYLVTKGVLSDGELAMALAMMPHYGGKLGDTLVGLGLLKPLEVFRHLTRQVRSKIIDVCTWTKGSFAWYAGRENPREAFPLDFNAFEILGAGAMALPDEVIETWIARNSETRLRASRTRRVGPERFEVKGLVELFETLDGRRSVGELVELHREHSEQIKAGRMLCLLEACDLAKAS